MRKVLMLVFGLVILGMVNLSIAQREQLIENGRTVILELAPVDPRSLMQGDYMALRYKVVNDAFPRGVPTGNVGGHLVLAPDEKGVARFKAQYNDQSLAPGEIRMRYRVRGGQIKFATNAWFFQEGHAKRYEPARYGEFRVAEDGEAILVAMRDAQLNVLGEEVVSPVPR